MLPPIAKQENNNTVKITMPGYNRIESIDIVRGIVMIIMALDHVRGYIHYDAFYFIPTDLSKTNAILFFTRFITHYCAPVFVLLAGISAFLYGQKRSRKELSIFLFKRGLWLIFVELFIIVFGRSFNPQYPYFNLQVIWAIGVSMIALSALIYLPLRTILLSGIALIALHNLLDNIHFPGNLPWALLHETGDFKINNFSIYVQYPLIPWIGIMAIGYCLGHVYSLGYDANKRKMILLICGLSSITLFVLLRSLNIYGDALHWTIQNSSTFNILSFLNVTKYPPSLLYTLITVGPALVLLAYTEKPLNALTSKIAVFGRVPFFYYVLHIYAIHVIALFAAVASGYHWSDMFILSDRVNRIPELKGYGFNLLTVYLVWIGLLLLLYPACKWFDRYKRSNQSRKWWLSYT